MNETKLKDTKPSRRRAVLANAWDFTKMFVKLLLICIALVSTLRFFVIEPFLIEGGSMEPSFEHKQRVLVDRTMYLFRSPARGDVVVFIPSFKQDERRDNHFIKRIIGLPGETVEISDTHIAITPADGGTSFVLDEPYITHHVASNETFTLLDGQYLVLGDNRPASSDSREWGTVTRKDIVGQAWLRIRPISDIEFLPGQYRYENSAHINSATE